MNRTSSATTYRIVSGTLILLALLAGLSPETAAAPLRLPAVFDDHAVLQRNVSVPVWGWAEPGETVAVSIAGQTAAATAGADGRWRVDLAPLAAGGPFELTVSAPSGSSRVA